VLRLGVRQEDAKPFAWSGGNDASGAVGVLGLGSLALADHVNAGSSDNKPELWLRPGF